ncbi:quinone oxidoreductase PIG3-like [Patiria miniata]|uniref:Enoyl reductase (ER) domain-containing protein n=1 Tax=Patiria miniata TaxID=46514 RepID=A0A914BTH3_PATMI|nr:quinone oxidoreductase PIG3-like [Patiria miniata]XP_038078868.1 quinone oxidoreductase PIG3-like [Patiria miniata]
MATMKAVRYDENGGAEKLYITEVKQPEPGKGQVLLKVYASAVNHVDPMQVAGNYTPPAHVDANLGMEAAGTVVKLGPGCSKWKIGDRVAALLGGGGNAEFVVAHEGHLMSVPGHMTMLEAAGIPEVWLTVYKLLHFAGHVKAGDRVLIHAGGSGTGTAAIQLVRLAGAEAIVTAGTQAKLDMAQELGAVAGFNYKQVDFADKVLEYTQNKGVDMILDCIGSSFWEQNLRSIAVEGTWVVYGLMGGAYVNGPALRGLMRKRLQLVGTNLRPRNDQYKTDLVQAFTENALLHFGKELKPITDSVFPLEEIAIAHRRITSQENIGKIVLSVCEEKQIAD